MNFERSIAATNDRAKGLVGRPPRTTIDRVSQVATVGLVIAFVTFLAFIAGFTAYGVRYSDRVYPGTTVAGVDLGGMTRAEPSTG